MDLEVLSIEGDLINISAPFYRSDILHQCDIAEDFAIAFGYNNIPLLVP